MEVKPEVKPMMLRDFPVDLRRQLKSWAALRGEGLRDLVIRYCQEGLQRDQKKRK
jgi:hypothetical protein